MRSRFTLALFTLAALLVASCGPVATPPTSTTTSTPAPAKLKVGVLGTTGDAPLYIAFEKGYFREQNLDIEFVQFGSALDMIAPLSAKQLDVGSGGIGAGLFNAFSQGIPIKLVAETVRTPENWKSNAWFVRSDLKDSVRSPADLKGRTVSLAATCTVIDTELSVLLEKGGLKRSDITVKTVAYADNPAAFASKSIDFTYGFEPYATTFQSTGVAFLWLTGGSVIPNHVQSGILYGPSITAQQDVAQRWMLAYLKGARESYKYYNSLPLPDDITNIVVKYGVQKDPARVKTSPLSPRNLDGSVDKNSVQTDLNFFKANNCIQGSPTVDQVVDNSYAEYAVSKLGKSTP
ncbi:MAG TPA: ABC transporter substrate-binding protein [Candidatus Limnocylindria bacterium]